MSKLNDLPRLLILAFLFVSSPAIAQGLLPTVGGSDNEAISIPDDITQDAVRDMVSRLSDNQVRQLLLQRLDVVARQNSQATETDRGPIDLAESMAEGVASSIAKAFVSLPRLMQTQAKSFTTFYEARGRSGTLEFLAKFAMALAGGLVASWLTQRMAGRWRVRAATVAGDESLGLTLKTLGLRLASDLSGLIVLIVVSRLITTGIMNDEDIPFVRLFILSLIALPMAMASIARFLMSPDQPHLRLVHTDDETAILMRRQMIILGLLVGFQIAIIDFNGRNGVPLGELHLSFWLTLSVLGYASFISYTGREGLKLMLRGTDTDLSPAEDYVAQAYPYALIVGCVLTWLLIESLVGQGLVHLIASGQPYITLFMLMVAPAMDTMVRGLVRHLVPPMKGEGPVAEEAFKATKKSYIRIGRLLLFGMILFVLSRIWQIDFSNLAVAGFGARAAATIIESLTIIGVGFLVHEFVTLWVNHKLSDEMTALGFDLNAEEPGGGEGGGVGGSRLSTVLPLLRLVLQSTVIVITFLLAVGHLGIDITPLLAGAGIVGLAIGFGAQKLVSDIVSGVFFLVDDAFRVGEYVSIEGTLGTVEQISIRSLQLRHHRGAVHTIPFGEIPKITNYSRDWVIMKLKFTVPFDTDVHKIKKIFKQIGKDLMEVPEFAQDLMQTFKSQGVLLVDDVGIVVRGKFMAKPGKQFTIRKEIYSRVQKAFKENGIEFARREVKVNIGDNDASQLTGADKNLIAAAATAAAKPEPENKK